MTENIVQTRCVAFFPYPETLVMRSFFKWHEALSEDDQTFGRCSLVDRKENMKLVDFSRRFFFCQGLFSFILSSAWKHLDAFFQLLTARQGVANGGRNSRCAIFGLMAQINRDFFQRPASL